MRACIAVVLTFLLLTACTRRDAPQPPSPPPQTDPTPAPEVVPPAPSEPAALIGTAWVADRIEGRGDLDNKESTLEFLEDGRATGKSGCNRYGGPVEISGNAIRFGDLMSTKMACDPQLAQQEAQFLAALAAARQYRMENWQLVLLDQSGDALLRLSTNRDPAS